jgi:hypothetical protein
MDVQVDTRVLKHFYNPSDFLFLTLCGPVANLLAFGFLNVHTGSQLFGF